MAVLEFDSVTKTFPGPVVALDRFTLRLAEGELAVVVGPSGAGKTTALRIAAGLEQATSGSIRMDGCAIDTWRPKDRDMAMVFHQPALYPHLTVRKNAAYSLRMRRAPRAEIDRRVQSTAGDLGIAELLDRTPDTLSGGQAQRVALARALVRRPNCLLLDEPFASLDAPLRAELRSALRTAHRRQPITTLLVTHDQEEALALADRLVVLRGGRIEQLGTAQEVFDRPANRFVASFLGSPPMNFFAGKVSQDVDRLWFDGGSFCLPIPASQQTALSPHCGQPIALGLRPEDFAPAPPPQAPADRGCLEVTVTHREFRGDRWIVSGRLKTGEVVAMTLREASTMDTHATVCWYIDARRAHYFAGDEAGRNLLAGQR